MAFKDEPPLHDQYVSRAMALLRQAKTLGYFENRQQIEQMNKEHDLDSLRGKLASSSSLRSWKPRNSSSRQGRRSVVV